MKAWTFQYIDPEDDETCYAAFFSEHLDTARELFDSHPFLPELDAVTGQWEANGTDILAFIDKDYIQEFRPDLMPMYYESLKP